MRSNINLLLIILGFSIISCSQEGDVVDPGPSTFSGSYAKMLTKGEFLYIVNSFELITVSIQEKSMPLVIHRQELDFGLESIFIAGDLMVIGSTSSLYIYTIQENGIPTLLSQTEYLSNDINPCDPVVVKDSFAFVTLSSASTSTDRCFRPISVNELRVYNIFDLNNPQLVSTYQMEEPKGLGIDDFWLFICEKENGLKVYNTQNIEDIQLIHHFEGFETYDVIPLNGLLIVVGPDNLYQFDYSDMNNMNLISKIEL